VVLHGLAQAGQAVEMLVRRLCGGQGEAQLRWRGSPGGRRHRWRRHAGAGQQFER
jgi:hypothetical protein